MKEDETKEKVPPLVYEEVLHWLEYATYYELAEIARKSYHLKMEKERQIARKHNM